MPFSVEMKVEGLEKLTDLASRFPFITEEHLGKAINRSLVRIWGAEKEEAPFGITGQLRDRWNIVLGRFTGALISGVPYALFVHEGTAPHWPPIDAITPWANKHGIPPFVLARSIAKKGTKANPFLQRAVDATKEGVDKEFDDALHAIVKTA